MNEALCLVEVLEPLTNKRFDNKTSGGKRRKKCKDRTYFANDFISTRASSKHKNQSPPK